MKQEDVSTILRLRRYGVHQLYLIDAMIYNEETASRTPRFIVGIEVTNTFLKNFKIDEANVAHFDYHSKSKLHYNGVPLFKSRKYQPCRLVVSTKDLRKELMCEDCTDILESRIPREFDYIDLEI